MTVDGITFSPGTFSSGQCCEPGTRRVGPLSRVMSSNMIGELVSHQSPLKRFLHVGMQRLVRRSPCAARGRLAPCSLIVAEQMLRDRDQRLDVQAAVEGRRLVEDVGDAGRAGLQPGLLPPPAGL